MALPHCFFGVPGLSRRSICSRSLALFAGLYSCCKAASAEAFSCDPRSWQCLYCSALQYSSEDHSPIFDTTHRPPPHRLPVPFECTLVFLVNNLIFSYFFVIFIVEFRLPDLPLLPLLPSPHHTHPPSYTPTVAPLAPPLRPKSGAPMHKSRAPWQRLALPQHKAPAPSLSQHTSMSFTKRTAPAT